MFWGPPLFFLVSNLESHLQQLFTRSFGVLLYSFWCPIWSHTSNSCSPGVLGSSSILSGVQSRVTPPTVVHQVFWGPPLFFMVSNLESHLQQLFTRSFGVLLYSFWCPIWSHTSNSCSPGVLGSSSILSGVQSRVTPPTVVHQVFWGPPLFFMVSNRVTPPIVLHWMFWGPPLFFMVPSSILYVQSRVTPPTVVHRVFWGPPLFFMVSNLESHLQQLFTGCFGVLLYSFWCPI